MEANGPVLGVRVLDLVFAPKVSPRDPPLLLLLLCPTYKDMTVSPGPFLVHYDALSHLLLSVHMTYIVCLSKTPTGLSESTDYPRVTQIRLAACATILQDMPFGEASKGTQVAIGSTFFLTLMERRRSVSSLVSSPSPYDHIVALLPPALPLKYAIENARKMTEELSVVTPSDISEWSTREYNSRVLKRAKWWTEVNRDIFRSLPQGAANPVWLKSSEWNPRPTKRRKTMHNSQSRKGDLDAADSIYITSHAAFANVLLRADFDEGFLPIHPPGITHTVSIKGAIIALQLLPLVTWATPRQKPCIEEYIRVMLTIAPDAPDQHILYHATWKLMWMALRRKDPAALFRFLRMYIFESIPLSINMVARLSYVVYRAFSKACFPLAQLVTSGGEIAKRWSHPDAQPIFTAFLVMSSLHSAYRYCRHSSRKRTSTLSHGTSNDSSIIITTDLFVTMYVSMRDGIPLYRMEGGNANNKKPDFSAIASLDETRTAVSMQSLDMLIENITWTGSLLVDPGLCLTIAKLHRPAFVAGIYPSFDEVSVKMMVRMMVPVFFPNKKLAVSFMPCYNPVAVPHTEIAHPNIDFHREGVRSAPLLVHFLVEHLKHLYQTVLVTVNEEDAQFCIARLRAAIESIKEEKRPPWFALFPSEDIRDQITEKFLRSSIRYIRSMRTWIGNLGWHPISIVVWDGGNFTKNDISALFTHITRSAAALCGMGLTLRSLAVFYYTGLHTPRGNTTFAAIHSVLASRGMTTLLTPPGGEGRNAPLTEILDEGWSVMVPPVASFDSMLREDTGTRRVYLFAAGISHLTARAKSLSPSMTLLLIDRPNLFLTPHGYPSCCLIEKLVEMTAMDRAATTFVLPWGTMRKLTETMWHTILEYTFHLIICNPPKFVIDAPDPLSKFQEQLHRCFSTAAPDYGTYAEGILIASIFTNHILPAAPAPTPSPPVSPPATHRLPDPKDVIVL